MLRNYRVGTQLVASRVVLSSIKLASYNFFLHTEAPSPGLEIREYGRWDPTRWPRGTLYPQKLALTSPTSGGYVMAIVSSRTQATQFFRDSELSSQNTMAFSA
jgi:hypothetical protein